MFVNRWRLDRQDDLHLLKSHISKCETLLSIMFKSVLLQHNRVWQPHSVSELLSACARNTSAAMRSLTRKMRSSNVVDGHYVSLKTFLTEHPYSKGKKLDNFSYKRGLRETRNGALRPNLECRADIDQGICSRRQLNSSKNTIQKI